MTFLAENWDNFMKNISDEPHGEKIYWLQQRQHLSDILQDIIINSSTGNVEISNIRELNSKYSKEQDLTTYPLYEWGTVKINKKRKAAIVQVDLGYAKKYYGRWDFVKEEYDGSYIVWPGRSADYNSKLVEISEKLGIKDDLVKFRGDITSGGFDINHNGKLVYSATISLENF